MGNDLILTLDNISFNYRRNVSSLTLKSLLLKPDVSFEDTLFRDFSLSLEKSKRYALVGDNGAGKSSLALMIMNKIFPTKGNVNVFGTALALFSDSDNLFQNLEIKEFTKIHLQLLWPTLSKAQLLEMVTDILNFSSLINVKNNKMESLSKGMRQKLLLTIYTAKSVDLLIIDESLSGVNSSFYGLFKARLDLCLGDTGTLILIDHNRSLLKEFCSDAIRLNKGKVFKLNIDDLELNIN
jgi:ABC-type polysaccharide/polyol phosphate transport system ATPase subunit